MRKYIKRTDGLNLSRCKVFFDFDNTITHFDVFDAVIKRFATDKRWVALERAWEEGKIGSSECIRGQLESVRVGRKELLDYLYGIRIDPYFRKLISLFRGYGVDSVILSDGFSFFIENILRNNKIKGIKVYSNKLKFSGDRLKPFFPFGDKSCRVCAHCKTKNLLRNSGKKVKIYIGDGLSDACPAEYADIVFAKKKLLRYCKDKKIPCLPYKNLKDIYNYFQRMKNER